MPNAPVGHRGRVAHQVEHGPAPEPHDVGVPVEVVSIDGNQQFLKNGRVVFALLAARNDGDGCAEAQHRRVGAGVARDSRHEARMLFRHAAIDHEKDFAGTFAAVFQ